MQSARVVLVSLHNPRADTNRVETNLANVLDMLDYTAAYDPDFVCFPEVTLHHAATQDGRVRELARPVPGPETEAVGEKAAALDSYVLLPLVERDGDDCYNAVVFIGPDGAVVGTYRKLAPTIAEMDQGIRPGTEVPTWETEFGRVGAFICWDIKYPEIGVRLGHRNLDLVFHPTLGGGDARLKTWAQYYGYHIALCDKHAARFYRPTGNVVAPTEKGWNLPEVTDVDLRGGSAAVSFAELNLDCRSYKQGPWVEGIGREYGGSIVFHEASTEGIAVVESVDAELSLDEVERELGMERTRDYENRIRARILEEESASPLFSLEGPD